MNNEELAKEIQSGNDELIPVLWEKVSPLLYMKSGHIYNHYKERCKQYGVELSDIYQSSYYAFLEAVRAFKSESDLKFNTYLEFPFKNTFFKLIGLKSLKYKNEPLNNCTSLNVSPENLDSDTSLFDIIADKNALDFVQEIDTIAESAIIRAEVDKLPELQRNVIQLYFFGNKSLAEIGADFGVSCERIRQIKYVALRTLRKNKILQEIYVENRQHQQRIYISRFRYQPEYFELVRNINKKPLSYGQRQAEILTAEINWWREHPDEC